MNEVKRWQFWIDRGGTFTDVVAKSPDGRLLTHKLLSDNPERYRDAALQGMRDILNVGPAEPLADAVEIVKMGTTVGTNALLERKGEPVALIITKGFKDCLRIAYQNRPDIFALNIQLPEQLYRTVVEIDERIDAQGSVLKTLDEQLAERQLQALYDQGLRAIAVVLLHAWRYPAHEIRLQKIAERVGFTQISISHQVSPLMKVVGRGDTTVVDAYLSPMLQRYVDQVASGLGGERSDEVRLMFMQSNGGLTDAKRFRGRDCILSGPAGGIVGAVAIAQQAGFDKIIAFDMGGTSTDVAHFAGEYERRFETEVAGVRMRVPMMAIHTVAAGGGSILHFDGMRYRVGPDSAGANPGPAGYRRGGPLTVTDANIMLGRLPLFPAVFGTEGNLPLDRDRVGVLFAELSQRIQEATGDSRSPEQVAEGFLDIAVENMAAAIKTISVQKGYDVSEYALCCYGAAAGQHACSVAERLGMRCIILHPFAGVLSAYGMGLADLRTVRQKALERPWGKVSLDALRLEFDALEREGHAEIAAQGVVKVRIEAVRRLFLRYQGTDTALAVEFAEQSVMLADFELQYLRQFGFTYADKPLVIESMAVEVIGLSGQDASIPAEDKDFEDIAPLTIESVFFRGRHWQTPVYRREQLNRNRVIDGPAIVIESTSTLVIDPGWRASVDQEQNLILTRQQGSEHAALATGASPDPVMLEIFNKLFISIAEQMGFVLQNTAHSVNIKERLDFSCALFDAQGELIANAPHIPVHLGSMGETVKCLLQNSDFTMARGDVFLVNSPYRGGTHLPDITIITPVFDRDRLLFFTASRGHHADIGGITPGSMPSHSRTIEEEGVLTSGIKIVEQGRFNEEALRQWLLSGDYPARNPDQNIADFQAQIAANEKGAQELHKMIAHYSLAVVQAYMRFVQDNAEASVRKILANLPDGQFRYALDDGAEIAVHVTVDRERESARIDFSGTSPQQSGNFNAPSAVCKAAVLYVFRTLVQDDIPLNAGCLKPLDIVIPEGSMLNPKYPAAVVAGNVETSQIIVDALYGALGVLAGSQGTMNNLTFGNQRYQYYETICGGAGAGNGFDGCSAVHTHMTNSRITDPEVLEWRFPVLLETFSIRQGSGGQGAFNGGNGVVRRIKFLEPMSVNILSSHRATAPFGLHGSEPGAAGKNSLWRASGSVESLGGCAQVEMQAGDVLQIETPGGGGYGSKVV
ncbi:hydantoinase B/oxoprolinase family protein [Methylotuvimicrobium alcaliphilum]|uniref:5-oxoprolinase n=1 Tax=Methylotuvimicrobium alcaliphilum (strain DSM 19304 / NCIMB 14124 / VKM B-2133 / 20Z) TaxID=1091494 RepID=G4SXZ4_META2|nr:hydantoinase B/oxoprolinase family protein [Methylotuvimicrobium alcaliphilum]CCE24295.1 5-oxoprolinase [Methylotuvimicrobium alcaliphilum 20Z]